MTPTPRTSSATLTLVLTALVVAAPLAAGGILPSDVPGATGVPWGAWRTETLDTRFVSPRENGIDVDSQDRPWIAYTEDSFHIIRRDHGVWVTQHSEPMQSQYSDIVLDASDTPHVVHSGPYPGKVYYTTQAPNGSWETSVLDDRDLDFEVHIALGPNGTPHVAYGVENTLYHQVLTDQGWVREEVDSTAGWLDMVVDSRGRVHLAYENWNFDNDIGYALRDANGTWTLEELAKCNTGPTIAVDAQDHPHVACHVPNVGLGYGIRTDDGNWSVTLIDKGDRIVYKRGGFYVGHDPSIVVDGEDRVHIAYRYKGNFFFDYPTHKGELHYIAQDANGSWVKEIVDHDGHQNGRGSDIALDSSDRPHISYVLQKRFQATGGPLQSYYDMRYATPLSEPLNLVGE